MAYATKYRCEIADIYGIAWKVDIQKDGFAGDIIALTGSGEPIEFEYFGEDDLFESRIMGSKVSISVVCNTDFEFSELFTSNNLEYKVLIYHGVTLYWNGYLLVNDYSEPYNCTPYYVTLTATDGLGLLKDFKFIDLGYTDRTKASVIIYDILSLVGITSFTEYVNIYGDTMTANVDTSPFDQMGIDPYLFESDTCYEAFEEILSLLNAGIRQDQGVFTIFRFRELRHASMKGRVFTSGSAKSSTTKTPEQLLKRGATVSALRDYEGGNRNIIPQIKTLYLNYDIKAKKSCLRNWEFKYEDFVDTLGVYTIPNWTANNCTISPFGVLWPGEDLGVYISEMPDVPTTEYIIQTIPNVKSRSPVFTLKYECKLLNADVNTADVNLHCLIKHVGSTTNYWTGSVWSTSPHSPPLLFTHYDNLPISWSDWLNIEFLVDGVPEDGDLSVSLYAAGSTNSSVSVVYRNVQLVMTPTAGSNETGIGYTVSAAANGQVIERELKLGDGFTIGRYAVNQLINYMGILNGYSGSDVIDPETVWNTYTAGTSNAEGKPLIEVTGGELGGQYERPKDLIDLPLRETDGSTFLSLVGNLQDSLNQVSGDNRIFGISRGRYKPKMREWELTLCEIL